MSPNEGDKEASNYHSGRAVGDCRGRGANLGRAGRTAFVCLPRCWKTGGNCRRPALARRIDGGHLCPGSRQRRTWKRIPGNDGSPGWGGYRPAGLWYAWRSEAGRNKPGRSTADFTANFTSAAGWCLAAANVLEKQGDHTLIVIGSVAGDRGRASNVSYGAAKGGLAVLVQGIAHRLAKSGASAVVVKPGFVDTPMTAHIARKGLLWAKPTAIGKKIVRIAERGSPRPIIYTPGFWNVDHDRNPSDAQYHFPQNQALMMTSHNDRLVASPEATLAIVCTAEHPAIRFVRSPAAWRPRGTRQSCQPLPCDAGYRLQNLHRRRVHPRDAGGIRPVLGRWCSSGPT